MTFAFDAWFHQGLIAVGVAILGLCGLAFSIAAQATLADVIDGVLILVDKPFRVRHRIQLQDLQTWGDVISIGVRTTRIRTLDNRLVIVPNSRIGRSQIVNYSYPDDRYRLEVNFGVAHGTDIEAVRQLSVMAVRQVDLILQDRPIEALVDALDDSAEQKESAAVVEPCLQRGNFLFRHLLNLLRPNQLERREPASCPVI